jgi:hypothetical protein
MSKGIIGNSPLSILSCRIVVFAQSLFLREPQSRRGQIQFHGQTMAVAGRAWQEALLVTATVLKLAAAKSRQFSGLQNLTFRALIPPTLLQVPEAQYPAVSGLTHLAATGIGSAAPTASAATVRARKGRFFDILVFVGQSRASLITGGRAASRPDV